jgi:N-acetylglucosamine-6-phosphate deacetylase
MGVEQVVRDAFTRARDYQAALAAHEKGEGPLPRPDLQLDAVSEILSGERAIHAHSYRQSEILMLMRTTEDFDTRVRCFQHILEGYKVADEMAAHGACASGFSDWWAYKFEVYDAIPYNGFLMWERGVSVSFNSDSSELARRLNTEAAKAVKYGGVPPDEALRFVTLNPAQQLGIDDRVGSLERGKDADFVIWSGSPLSTLAHADETWVDGRRYFDRAADLGGRAALAQERAALLARAREAGEKGGASGGGRDGRRAAVEVSR